MLKAHSARVDRGNMMNKRMIELDTEAGDVGLIIRGDGSVVLLLPSDDAADTSDDYAPTNVGLIAACGYLLTEDRAECQAMLGRLAQLVSMDAADA